MRFAFAAAACALGALALTACERRDTEPTPAGSQVAGAMPDTNAPRAPDTAMTAPDAGATGAVEPTPAQGGAGNVAGETVPNPEASPQSGGR
jgi:hypothetical protein